MTFFLGQTSLQRLKGVNIDLQKVVHRAIELSSIDFRVLEGVRSKARQKALVAAGASRTMNSRHLTGHAVDLGALIKGKIAWDWPLYTRINEAMQKASKELGIPITWGGNWPRLKDGPHFELPRNLYP